MSIQRWDHIGGEGGAWAYESDTGPMVAYADHVAALVAARDRGYGEAMDDCWCEPGHIKAAVADALQQARVALELLPVSLVDTRFDPDDERRYVQAVRLTTALAAIDALLEGEQA